MDKTGGDCSSAPKKEALGEVQKNDGVGDEKDGDMAER